MITVINVARMNMWRGRKGELGEVSIGNALVDIVRSVDRLPREENGESPPRGKSPSPSPYTTTDSSSPAPTHCHSLHVCPATQSESLKQSMWARFMSSGTQATYGEFSSL